MTLRTREPDIDNLLKVLRGEKTNRVPLFELFMDGPVNEHFAGHKPDEKDPLGYLKLLIDSAYHAGFDYATTHACSISFPTAPRDSGASVSMNGGAMISDWESFEAYPWPEVSACDFSMLDEIRDYLPKGMKLAVMGPGGVLENVTAILGYDNLCLMLYDEPELLEAVFQRVGETLVEYYARAAAFDTVAFLISNDDWGFNTQTFLSLPDMRRLVFPWHKKIVEVIHAKGKPAVLHSCGYMNDVFDDIIDEMKYDAKHSYEDNILSVEESYERWGDRITILGGLDLQYLSASDCDDIYERCMKLMERTRRNGRYALGTGNSMAYYIPVDRYEAMIRAAQDFNRRLFVQGLVEQMTLEEKLGQMTQLAPEFIGIDPSIDLTGPMNALHVQPRWLDKIGSTLNGFGAKTLRRVQEHNMKESRLGIPLLFMADVVYGYRTSFPIPLAIGCSFNPKNYEKVTHVTAMESAASGIHLTFAPMTDLVRDPRWGRVMESTGEDAYLNSVMTKAAIHGFQGDDFKEKGRIAACVKHFAAYGAPWGGRDYNIVDLSQGLLREYYLPAYKAAVDAHVAMVMTSFNTVNRIPASANTWLLRDILRKEWGFEGVVISDYAAVDETIAHGVSADGAQAAQKCITAGVDIEMMSTHYLSQAQKLLDEGRLDIGLVDEAVTRILELKYALGLFDNPYKDASEEDEARLHQCAEFLRISREVASECAVLLKNDGVLPLKGGQKIGLTGPFAGSGDILGGWTAGKQQTDATLYTGLKACMPEAEIVTAMTGSLGSLQEGVTDVADEIQDVLDRFKDCDVIIAAVGENSGDTGEAASKAYLRLSRNQERLMYALKSLGKPVVMVVFSGRPMEIYPVLDCAGAVLQAWFLGSQSGLVLGDLLTGRTNPSGRLSMSFPYTAGQIPVHYNAFNTGRPAEGKTDRYLSKYLDCPNEALYCFGYGLSYSEFEYSDFKVEYVSDARGPSMQGDAKEPVLKASVTVKNVSQAAGKETVQLYIRDIAARVVRPLKELRGFSKIHLEPGEAKEVSFAITREMLSYWDNEGEFVFEPGEFDIMVGRNSSDVETERVIVE